MTKDILQRIHQRFEEFWDDKLDFVGDGVSFCGSKEEVKQFITASIFEVLTEVVPKILGEGEVEDSMNNSFKDGYWARGSEAKARFKEIVEGLKGEKEK